MSARDFWQQGGPGQDGSARSRRCSRGGVRERRPKTSSPAFQNKRKRWCGAHQHGVNLKIDRDRQYNDRHEQVSRLLPIDIDHREQRARRSQEWRRRP